MLDYSQNKDRISLLESPGFVLMHLACFLVIWAGISWTAVIACLLSYLVRMFGITAGYHRYFSHRAFKTSRLFQFVLACLGAAAAQQGPLWWAAHHRNHHKHPDTIDDVHSPVVQGFWWSHFGWLLCPKNSATDLSAVPDLAKYRELRFINRYHLLSPAALAISLFLFGGWLARIAPGLGTSGFQMVVWGFIISTVLLYHGTFAVNSLAHVFGSRPFITNDNSRNNVFVALITLGEGWHNNHHYYPSSERHGFQWWEIDISHGILRMLSWVTIVWSLRTPPEEIRHSSA